MSLKNRIRSLLMELRTLNPAEADVRFHVTVDCPDDRLGVKGRLVGPRCAYASTVEVAYPFRDAPPGEPNGLGTRAIIPEPNLWEPVCPFLYEVTLELFDDRGRIDGITLSVGLRTIAISGSSFVLNGKHFELKAMNAVQTTESDLALARKQFNAIVLPVADNAKPLWHACDRIGLGVFGRIVNESQSAAEHLANHACLLAWIVDDDKRFATVRADLRRANVPIGLQIRNDVQAVQPLDADFFVVGPHAGQTFQKWGKPVMELASNP